MTDAFAELVTPIFRDVIELKDDLSYNDSPGFDAVKKRTRGWVEAAEQRAQADPGLAAEFALAKYGLVAWIDEVLADSSWGASVGWATTEHVLEWDIYESNDRAWQFYKHAKKALDSFEHRVTSIDPLEVYFLCVALGFRGELSRDEGELLDWVDAIYAKIREADSLPARPFSENPGDSKTGGLGPRRGPGLLLRASVMTAITAVVTLVGYLVAVHVDYNDQPF